MSGRGFWFEAAIPPIPLVSSLSHNHRGQLTRLNRPGTVLDTLYFYYEAAAAHPGLAQVATYIYEQINYYSYGPGQSAANPNDPRNDTRMRSFSHSLGK